MVNRTRSQPIYVEYEDENIVGYRVGKTNSRLVVKSFPDGGKAEFVGSRVDYREFGDWLKPNQDIGSNWQLALDQLQSGQTIEFGQGEFLFSSGARTRKRINICGSGHGTQFKFIPTTPKSIWLTADGVNGNSTQLTEELQLDQLILRDFKLISDRSIRARGFRFRRCDNVDIRNIQVLGLAGYSLNLESSREFSIGNWRSRFCGYLDNDSVHLSEADWIWQTKPTFHATITQNIVASASPQTVTVSSTIYQDPEGGVTLGLSSGAGVLVGSNTATRESVTIQSLTSTTITAVFSQNHSSGDSITITPDSTNFLICNDVKLIFPFWDALQVIDSPTNSTTGIMIHMIPDGSTTNGQLLEGNVIRQFGGTKGFTGGVPNNIFAALHVPVTGNESSVTGLKFHPERFAWASAIYTYKARNNRIGVGNILGGGTNYVIRAEGNGSAANLGLQSLVAGDLYLTNLEISAANSSTANLTPFSQVGASITVDPNTDIVTVGGTLTVPPTGYPVMFKHASNDASLPAGIVGYGQCMYSIRISASTMRLARTKENALAGVYVDITSVGTGTSYIQTLTGCVLAAFGGSHIFVDQTVKLSNGMQPFTRDSFQGTPYGTSVFGIPVVGADFSVQQVIKFVVSTGNPNAAFAGTQFGLTGEKFFKSDGTAL